MSDTELDESLSRKDDPNRAFQRRLWYAIIASILVLTIACVFIFKNRYVFDPTPAMKKMAVEIGGSIASYKSDYALWPMATGTVDWDGDTGTSNWLDALSGDNTIAGSNPRKSNYLDGFKPAVNLKGKMSYGIDLLTNQTHPQILDYWGKPFKIRVDANGDGEVANPSGGPPIRKSCVLWGAGPDGDFATWSDNIGNW